MRRGEGVRTEEWGDGEGEGGVEEGNGVCVCVCVCVCVLLERGVLVGIQVGLIIVMALGQWDTLGEPHVYPVNAQPSG